MSGRRCHHRGVTDPILSPRALNRALLARQLLLERSTLPIADAVEQVGGLQTQYAPSGYVGLWTRLRDFPRDALTTALEERSVIQATLMRVTIHVVSRREFWPYATGVRQARRQWALRTPPAAGGEAAMIEAAERIRAALSDGPRTVKELGELGAGFVGNLGLWVDLVRVPPSGTWERRRADRLALAETWVGPCDATEAAGREHVVRAYLRAFGPAPWRDIASWAGFTATEARQAGEGLTLVRYRDEEGRELVDLPGAPLARSRDAGARSVPAALGREPAGPRETNGPPAGAAPAPDLQHPQPILGRDVPGRRRRGRCLVPQGRPDRAGPVPGPDHAGSARRGARTRGPRSLPRLRCNPSQRGRRVNS